MSDETWTQIISVSTTVLAFLGGGSVIVVGLSVWIGKLLGDRYVERVKRDIQHELEGYKTQLKKSEFLFEKEYEAASQFVGLRRKLMPRYRFPEMIWDDACEDFACNFERVAQQLTAYLSVNGAVLKPDVLKKLSDAVEAVEEGKFEVRRDEVSAKGVEIAGNVMKELEAIETLLRDAVLKQTAI